MKKDIQIEGGSLPLRSSPALRSMCPCLRPVHISLRLVLRYPLCGGDPRNAPLRRLLKFVKFFAAAFFISVTVFNTSADEYDLSAYLQKVQQNNSDIALAYRELQLSRTRVTQARAPLLDEASLGLQSAVCEYRMAYYDWELATGNTENVYENL